MAAEDKKQPIIIKKIIAGGHAHHGGSWKVAYADFVTAMMAFFLLLWLLGITDEQQRNGIADYFKNPTGVQGIGGASTSMIKLGGAKDFPVGDRKPRQKDNKKSKKSDRVVGEKNKQSDGNQSQDTPTDKIKAKENIARAEDKRQLDELLELLERSIDKSAALKPYKDQLFLDVTPDGLRIQIIDKENRSMFDLGSAEIKPYTIKILNEIAKTLRTVPNRISISGHTDSIQFHKGYQIYENDYGEEIKLPYSNWELSADRANAARRVLLKAGVRKHQIGRVVGFASSIPFDKSNPRAAANRRITIIVMNRDTQLKLDTSEGPVHAKQTLTN